MYDSYSRVIYSIPVRTIDGRDTTLGPYEGQVMLIVNTASNCGFTPQYAGLESLYKRFGDRGLAVLGFPCNQFGHQEPGPEAEILGFCQRNYGVTFPMFAKIFVNGERTHPLFVHLKREKPGLLGSETIKWNFTKFLVDRAGRVQDRFSPRTPPSALTREIEKLL
jgi:glutathione peroxidase